MHRDVVGAVGAHLDEPGSAAAARTSSGRGRRAVLEAGQRGHLREVDAARRGDVLLVRSRRAVLGHRQEVEDPAAAVVHAHDRELGAGAARGEQAAEVVEQRQLAGEQPARGRRWPAPPRRPTDTTPSMPLAPRFARKRSGLATGGRRSRRRGSASTS